MPDPPPDPPGAVPGHTRRGRAPLLPDPCRPQAQSPHFSPGRWILYEPFAKFGVGHEMGAECSCKITPSKGICTWLAMGFPGTITLPDNKSRFLANFAKGSMKDCLSSAPFCPCFWGLRVQTALGAHWLGLFPSARTGSLEWCPRYALRSRARAEGKIPAPLSRPPVRNAG